MNNYFQSCQTLDEAKALYKKLAFELHPDVSGYDSTAAFQEMQNQFERFEPKTEKYQSEFQHFNASNYMQIIEDLLKIEGLDVELVGSFIWIGGETYTAKNQIKAIQNDQFKPAAWHRKKQLWYFAPADYNRFSNQEFSIEELREKYGSEKFQRQNPNASKNFIQ